MHDINIAIAAKTVTGKRSREGFAEGVSGRALRRQRPERENDVPAYPEKPPVNPVLFPFLNGIQANEIDIFNARLVQQKYDRKEYVYLPYDNSEKVCFVIHGNVEIGYLDESGRELSIDILGPGKLGPAGA